MLIDCFIKAETQSHVHIISEEPETLKPGWIKVLTLLDSRGINYWPHIFLVITYSLIN